MEKKLRFKLNHHMELIKMSETKSGVVERTNVREGTGGPYFSMLVSQIWYGTYKDDHSDKQGKAVIFEADHKDGKYWNATKVRLDPSAAAAPAAAPAASGGAYQDNRQSSIVLQSSYKTAAEVVCALISADKLTMGAKKDSLEIALGLVDEAAVRIYTRCINPAEFFARRDAGSNPDPDAKAATAYDPCEA